MVGGAGSRVVVLGALVLLGFANLVASYRSVIFMHGLLAGKEEIEDFQRFLDKYHPGTNVTFIDQFKYLRSFEPMWKQVADVRGRVEQIMLEHPEGVHMVCFSQGGLVCRGVLETLPNHNVRNFISLSSPQGGQYGTTNYLAPILPPFVTKNAYRFFYTKWGQHVSLGNYWNDPHHQNLFSKWSNFLAVINNQSSANSSFSRAFRDNFVRLKNLILIGGPDDGVITPWQSSRFGIYGDKENVIEMKDQRLFKEDWFGLRTLDQRSSIHLYTVPGVKHTSWHHNETVFLKCIQPWLD